MPITDSDIVNVVLATRSGSTNIKVRVNWTDGFTGENRGQMQLEWATADEFKAFLEGQDFADVMRAVLLQCINRNTGTLRGAVFDALMGKRFTVLQRVNEIV